VHEDAPRPPSATDWLQQKLAVASALTVGVSGVAFGVIHLSYSALYDPLGLTPEQLGVDARTLLASTLVCAFLAWSFVVLLVLSAWSGWLLPGLVRPRPTPSPDEGQDESRTVLGRLGLGVAFIGLGTAMLPLAVYGIRGNYVATYVAVLTFGLGFGLLVAGGRVAVDAGSDPAVDAWLASRLPRFFRRSTSSTGGHEGRRADRSSSPSRTARVELDVRALPRFLAVSATVIALFLCTLAGFGLWKSASDYGKALADRYTEPPGTTDSPAGLLRFQLTPARVVALTDKDPLGLCTRQMDLYLLGQDDATWYLAAYPPAAHEVTLRLPRDLYTVSSGDVGTGTLASCRR
jgi:hypothetical protein